MSYISDKESAKHHFDSIAKDYDYWKEKNRYYHDVIKSFVLRNIRPQAKVLEIGCGTGAILSATNPSLGVGVDISPGMIQIAKAKYPQYQFYSTPFENFQLDEKFDYIIMIDVVDHVYDVIDVFKNISRFCHPRTKIILTTINPWWDPILDLMEKFHAKMPEGPHNFIEKRHIKNMMELVDFRVNFSGYLLLFPKKIPILSYLANTVGIRTWLINKFSSVQSLVIQPMVRNNPDLGYGASVIIPCYNEEGNIADAIRRVPPMGARTEIIVVNDGSKDKTADIVRGMQKDYPNLRLIDYSPNRGKGYAMQQGFAAAQEEILMILDADMSVPPEELLRFFEPLNHGKAEFVNGTRMVYPMENQAMRTLNLFGNKLFSLMMTYIVQQNLSDTLCGTKAFYKSEYAYYKMGVDKWGDYDLLFSAAKRGNRILEVPTHYKTRVSGESKMKTLRHGIHLLKACIKGFKEIVFIPIQKY
jgi:ubiquinone/menaquinone biosynthesis C-methylase UbiE